MNKLKKLILIAWVLFLGGFLLAPSQALAIVDPLSVPNNRFGIHILNEGDIAEAASLVNSNGGEWGYVTLVIEDTDRNHDKWQNIFDALRERHLIPIVRMATHGQGQTWVKPVVGEAPAWASFLNSLNWVVKNRYVVIFNEPNHSSEWGNTLAPSEYADVLAAYAHALKQENPDFFVLNAGFDASAPNSLTTRDEQAFISGMIAHNANVFDNLDGWASHSYPNPEFSSSPQKAGRGGIKNYVWEAQILKNLGVGKDFSIFITETGWSTKNLPENKVAEYYKEAYESVWNDPRVVAVTPFVFDYQGEPFSSLSWKKSDGLKNQYAAVQALAKTVGLPEQVHKVTLRDSLSDNLITSSTYFINTNIKNSGESIWEENEGYFLTTESTGIEVYLTPSPLHNLKPFQDQNFTLTIKTPRDPGEYTLKINLNKNRQVLGESVIKIITVLKPEVKGKQSPKNLWYIFLHPGAFLGYLKNALLG